jgi:hypothetical protein
MLRHISELQSLIDIQHMEQQQHWRCKISKSWNVRFAVPRQKSVGYLFIKLLLSAFKRTRLSLFYSCRLCVVALGHGGSLVRCCALPKSVIYRNNETMPVLLFLRSNSTDETPSTVTPPGCRSQFVVLSARTRFSNDVTMVVPFS